VVAFLRALRFAHCTHSNFDAPYVISTMQPGSVYNSVRPAIVSS